MGSRGQQAVERSLGVSDELPVTARSSGALAADPIDVLSPELVLVDPSLREAWQRCVDHGDPRPEPARAPARSVDDPAAAVRTLARVALDADVRPRRMSLPNVSQLRLVAGAAAAAAVVAIAFLAADAGLPGADESRVADAGAPAEAPAGEVALTTPTSVRERRVRERSPTGARATTIPGPMARRFVWAPVEDATGYHVELFLAGARVFANDTPGAEIEIPAKWRFDGRRHELEAVAYDWYVWPVVAGKRSPTAVVQATLVVRDR